MHEHAISMTPEGELRIKVGRDFDLAEALRCMRLCPHRQGGLARRAIFDLLGTRRIETAGLGFMLMALERSRLTRENAVILYDHEIGRLFRFAHFERKSQLVRPAGSAQAMARAGASAGERGVRIQRA
ncbi:MAG: hypothetical protein FJ209_01100 [Betaproteobacteria bacterium]|nr:hypothetical protein [Betaproteobacteria bacterium]